MAKSTMVDRLLDAADSLLTNGVNSSTFRRRAVSTAYYAVFHALAKVCADNLLNASDRNSDEYLRVYRSLDHGTLKSAFGANGPMKARENLLNIGNVVVRLQSERHRADYLPPVKGVFTSRQAREWVDQARDAVSHVNSLSAADRRILAVSLLFKNRST